MTRVKMIVNNSHSEMESAVNQWLEVQENIQVKQVLQHIYCDNNDIPWITITIVYCPGLDKIGKFKQFCPE